MIKAIEQEPILKKMTINLVISFIVCGLILTMFHIKQIDNIYKEQMVLTERIIGNIIEKYPDEELAIMDSIIENNQVSQKKGKDILQKYGYKESNIFADNNFKGYAYKSIGIFSVAIFLLIAFNLLILKKFFAHILEVINNISNYIDNFMENNYRFDDLCEREGLFMRLISQISSLGKKLDIEIYKLNLEKENLKSLVTDISHQLKTPLASIKLYNSILLEEGISDEDRNMFLKRNEASTTKLHNLIDALVNISRLESSMININPEYKSIRNTIIKAINSAYMKAMEKDISINLDKFEDIKIYHDTKWTEESIFNILDNAIKYTQKGGTIDIFVSETVNYFRLDIKDNGIGISKDEINNLFKRFYRSDRQEVKDIEGSGVGLYLVRKIIERQGGNIIASKNIDRGSTFSLLLQKCETN